ncbi:uncharacterized protein P174DRAFT_419911 [Aspergillus novofumigatus IBT 16806]|uniref:Uncharacterized protein n=1 Tax=Aspergillus novofumigatus (strain IBT 16806) TaxID=1392255 RepID=A0A2I1CEI4_ASPN1|nr:uncharacterized protein P174DRAFT_419911 [Aspergillus novofumigatus IBT 16806]PKX96024.1 hypothetical protein P174DRAFT_419911 [Aspergillus novofumigatus IBT 16806]
MTCRNAAQGEVARQHVEQAAGITGQGKVQIRGLDMSRAGIINAEFVESPEGWLRNGTATSCSSPPETTSIRISQRGRTGQRRKGSCIISAARENWRSRETQPNYAVSKPTLMYVVEQICKQAAGADGTVQVIVNSVCPGRVYTSIARSIVEHSKLMQLLVPWYLGSLGKSADYGARFYVTAAMTTKEEHGKYVQSLFTDEEYHRLAIANMQSDTAKKVKALVWMN